MRTGNSCHQMAEEPGCQSLSCRTKLCPPQPSLSCCLKNHASCAMKADYQGYPRSVTYSVSVTVILTFQNNFEVHDPWRIQNNRPRVQAP